MQRSQWKWKSEFNGIWHNMWLYQLLNLCLFADEVDVCMEWMVLVICRRFNRFHGHTHTHRSVMNCSIWFNFSTSINKHAPCAFQSNVIIQQDQTRTQRINCTSTLRHSTDTPTAPSYVCVCVTLSFSTKPKTQWGPLLFTTILPKKIKRKQQTQHCYMRILCRSLVQSVRRIVWRTSQTSMPIYSSFIVWNVFEHVVNTCSVIANRSRRRRNIFALVSKE